MFSFGEKTTAVDEHAAQPGAATPAPSAGSVSAHTVDAARKAAEQQLSVSPRGRGRPRKDASVGGGDNRNVQTAIDAEIARQLEVLHEPEQWSALLCLPADAAKTWTGHARWTLDANERKTLGMTGSAFARTMMITNPRGLAALMLTSALFSTYVPRAMAQLKEMREESEKKKAADESKK